MIRPHARRPQRPTDYGSKTHRSAPGVLFTTNEASFRVAAPHAIARKVYKGADPETLSIDGTRKSATHERLRFEGGGGAPGPHQPWERPAGLRPDAELSPEGEFAKDFSGKKECGMPSASEGWNGPSLAGASGYAAKFYFTSRRVFRMTVRPGGPA